MEVFVYVCGDGNFCVSSLKKPSILWVFGTCGVEVKKNIGNFETKEDSQQEQEV